MQGLYKKEMKLVALQITQSRHPENDAKGWTDRQIKGVDSQLDLSFTMTT